jgi:hypothetical protein
LNAALFFVPDERSTDPQLLRSRTIDLQNDEFADARSTLSLDPTGM